MRRPGWVPAVAVLVMAFVTSSLWGQTTPGAKARGLLLTGEYDKARAALDEILNLPA